MKSTTKRRIGFGAMLSLAVVSVAALSSMNASAVPPPEATAPYIVQFGSVTIQLTSRAGVVTFAPAGGGANVTQLIRTVNPCSKIVFDPTSDSLPGDLITLTPIVNNTTKATDTVQIPSDAIGVHDSTNCGGPAGLVGPNEKLRIGVGSYFGAEVTASTATLVVGKSNTQDGKLIVAFGSEVQAARNVNVGGQTFAGLKPTTGTFKEITMSSDASQSSRGLSAKSGTALNLVVPGGFELAVNCGQQVTQPGLPGDIAAKAVFFRGENAAKQMTGCVDVGVTVEIKTLPVTIPGVPVTGGPTDQRVVYWVNSRTGVDSSTQAVNGTVTINWVPVPVADASRLDRQIDYDGPGTAAGFTPTLWCTSFSSSTDPTTGKVTLNGVLPNYIGAGSISVSGVDKAPWCLVSDTRVLNGDGTISQTEVLFGSGDPYRG